MSGVPWTVSATTIVRNALSTHRYLKAPQIWAIGTQGIRPTLQPKLAFDKEGRIRMKKVSNIREGKRQWVPPPQKPLPDHPFQSMRFLKQSILASLESQGLIHNAKLYVPIRTKEELLDAERGQAKRYRRAVLEAKRERAPLPTRMPEMKTTVADYYWSLGPLPEDIEERRSLPELDEPLTKEEVDFKAPPAAWAQAERLEEHFHKARLMDEENIAERKRIRKEKYLEERQQRKLQREEDIRLGRDGRLAQERRRMRALQSIEEYAQQTGEDVSDWIEELETAELGDEFPDRLPSFRPVHTPRIDGRVRLTPLPPRKNWKKTAVNRK